MSSKTQTSRNAARAELVPFEAEDEGAAPLLPSPLQAQTEALGLSVGTDLENELVAAGVTLVDVDTVMIPTIRLEIPGQGFFGRFLDRTDPQQKKEGDSGKWKILLFDVLDVKRYRESKNADQSVLYRGQISETTSLKPYFSDPKNKGSIVVLTYMGEQETGASKDGKRAAPKLYRVKRVAAG